MRLFQRPAPIDNDAKPGRLVLSGGRIVFEPYGPEPKRDWMKETVGETISRSHNLSILCRAGYPSMQSASTVETHDRDRLLLRGGFDPDRPSAAQHQHLLAMYYRQQVY